MALQHEVPSRQPRLPRATRESALRFEVPQSGSPPHRSASPRTRSPPISSDDAPNYRRALIGGRRIPDGPVESWSTTPYTRDFAPARGSYEALRHEIGQHAHSASAPILTQSPEEILDDNILSDRILHRQDTPPADSWETSSLYPHLRRVGHLSPRPPGISRAQLQQYDGLGDRLRSPSTSSNGSNDAWDTLLTTLEPDEHLPSADSSFTSATASSQSLRSDRRSVSRSGPSSARSSQTPATSLGATNEILDSGVGDPCHTDGERDDNELDEDSDSMMHEINEMERRVDAMRNNIRSERNRIRHSHEQRIPSIRRELEQAWRRRRAARAEAQSTMAQSSHGTVEPRSLSRSPRRVPTVSLGHLMPEWHEPSAYATMSHGETEANAEISSVTPDHLHVSDFRADEADIVENEIDLWHRRANQENRYIDEQQARETDAEVDTNADLGNMQRFIERMARREDIPESWWAAAGLSRTVREAEAEGA